MLSGGWCATGHTTHETAARGAAPGGAESAVYTVPSLSPTRRVAVGSVAAYSFQKGLLVHSPLTLANTLFNHTQPAFKTQHTRRPPPPPPQNQAHMMCTN